MRTALALVATLALAGVGNAQTTKPMPAKPMATKPATPAATAPKMATHTTKSGKTITYDCSKKGNMTKTACKK